MSGIEQAQKPRTEALLPPASPPAQPSKRRARPRRLSTAGINGLRLAILAGLLLIWDLAVRLHWVNPLFAAGPIDTFTYLRHALLDADFWMNVLVTLREAFYGWVIGGGLGLVGGLVMGRARALDRVLSPFLNFANATPKIGLAPILILWFGIGELSKVVLAAVVVYFIVAIPTQAAVALVDDDLDVVMTSLGANRVQKLTKLVLPGVLPAVFGAFRLGATFSLLTVVFAEMLAAKAGLGQLLQTSSNQFNMSEAFGVMIVLALLALALNMATELVEKRLLVWSSNHGRVLSL